MKKNRMMRAASALLVAVLMTTCTISGTFAKYVTTASSSDSARVAKWGVTVAVDGTTFADAYGPTVKGESSAKVVAPGTDGTLAGVTISGIPEVAARVTYDATVELGNNWIDADDMTKFYCPLWVTIGATTLCGLDYATADAFETAIEDNIAAATQDYAPGINLSNASDDLAVSWKWLYESNGYVAPGGATQTDAKDTFLGNRADGDIANAGTISLNLAVTVTQID